MTQAGLIQAVVIQAVTFHAFDVRQGALDVRVEVVTVDGRVEPVAEDEVLEPCSQLDEREVDALGVQLGRRAARACRPR